MRNLELLMPATIRARSSALSPAAYKALDLLRKGCAYQVRGAWRFRGLRGRVKEPTLLVLVARGLAERVETDRFSELRITPSGRCVDGDAGAAL